jgi:hypothetical protein
MPTRKIADFDQKQICRDPGHNPPTMMLFEPGIYEHECPSCHNKMIFTVPPRPSMYAGQSNSMFRQKSPYDCGSGGLPELARLGKLGR